jgi:hypothetical protein
LLWHTLDFHQAAQSTAVNRRLFQRLVHRERTFVELRPWDTADLDSAVDTQYKYIGMLGTALFRNHSYLMEIAFPSVTSEASKLNIYDAMALIRLSWSLCQDILKALRLLFYNPLSTAPFEWYEALPEIHLDLHSHALRSLFPRLVYACRQGHVAVIRLLNFSPFDTPIDKDIIDYLLVEAAGHGNGRPWSLSWVLPAMRVLIKHGARLLNALERAILGGYVNIVQILVYSHHGAPLQTMPTSETIPSSWSFDIHDMIIVLIPSVESYCRLLDSAAGDENIGHFKCLVNLARYRPKFMCHDNAEEKISAALLQALDTGHLNVVDFLLTHNRIAVRSSGKIHLLNSR